MIDHPFTFPIEAKAVTPELLTEVMSGRYPNAVIDRFGGAGNALWRGMVSTAGRIAGRLHFFGKERRRRLYRRRQDRHGLSKSKPTLMPMKHAFKPGFTTRWTLRCPVSSAADMTGKPASSVSFKI